MGGKRAGQASEGVQAKTTGWVPGWVQKYGVQPAKVGRDLDRAALVAGAHGVVRVAAEVVNRKHPEVKQATTLYNMEWNVLGTWARLNAMYDWGLVIPQKPESIREYKIYALGDDGELLVPERLGVDIIWPLATRRCKMVMDAWRAWTTWLLQQGSRQVYEGGRAARRCANQTANALFQEMHTCGYHAAPESEFRWWGRPDVKRDPR